MSNLVKGLALTGVISLGTLTWIGTPIIDNTIDVINQLSHKVITFDSNQSILVDKIKDLQIQLEEALAGGAGSENETEISTLQNEINRLNGELNKANDDVTRLEQFINSNKVQDALSREVYIIK